MWNWVLNIHTSYQYTVSEDLLHNLADMLVVPGRFLAIIECSKTRKSRSTQSG